MGEKRFKILRPFSRFYQDSINGSKCKIMWWSRSPRFGRCCLTFSIKFISNDKSFIYLLRGNGLSDQRSKHVFLHLLYHLLLSSIVFQVLSVLHLQQHSPPILSEIFFRRSFSAGLFSIRVMPCNVTVTILIKPNLTQSELSDRGNRDTANNRGNLGASVCRRVPSEEQPRTATAGDISCPWQSRDTKMSHGVAGLVGELIRVDPRHINIFTMKYLHRQNTVGRV